MGVATYIVIGLQVVLCLILIVVVLFQSGNQRGLSGSIAGGAETFFGKNKGRTLDAKLKKWTSVIAALFLVTSIALGFMIDSGSETAETPVDIEQQVEGEEVQGVVEGEADVEEEVAPEGETETNENSETTAE